MSRLTHGWLLLNVRESTVPYEKSAMCAVCVLCVYVCVCVCVRQLSSAYGVY